MLKASLPSAAKSEGSLSPFEALQCDGQVDGREKLRLSAICLRAAVPDLLSEFSAFLIHSGSNSPALSCMVRHKSDFCYGDWKSHLTLSSDPYCKSTWGWLGHA